jgi:hypothetical protein
MVRDRVVVSQPHDESLEDRHLDLYHSDRFATCLPGPIATRIAPVDGASTPSF